MSAPAAAAAEWIGRQDCLEELLHTSDPQKPTGVSASEPFTLNVTFVLAAAGQHTCVQDLSLLQLLLLAVILLRFYDESSGKFR